MSYGAIMMAIKIETVTRFYDEGGNIITESARTASVPGIEEIDSEGFRAAFNQLETTVLEITDSTRQAAVSGLLGDLSKKNGIRRTVRRITRREDIYNPERAGRIKNKRAQMGGRQTGNVRQHRVIF